MLRLMDNFDTPNSLIAKHVAVIGGLGRMGHPITEALAEMREHPQVPDVMPGRLYCTTRSCRFVPAVSPIASQATLLYLSDDPDANRMVTERADLVILAVKPSQIMSVLESISPAVTPDKIIVSLAVGVDLATLEGALPPQTTIVRAMPNLPVMTREGLTAVVSNSRTNHQSRQTVHELFNMLGGCVEVSEEHFALMAAVSGSGPAYMAYLMLEMVRAAQELGLPKDLAQAAVRQTWIGTAGLLKDPQMELASLVRQVMSPRGTTESALGVMSEENMQQLWQRVLEAALQRGEQIRRETKEGAMSEASSPIIDRLHARLEENTSKDES